MRIEGLKVNVSVNFEIGSMEIGQAEYDAILKGNEMSHSHRMDRKRQDMMEDVVTPGLRETISEYVAESFKAQMPTSPKSEFDKEFKEVEAHIARIQADIDDFKKRFYSETVSADSTDK